MFKVGDKVRCVDNGTWANGRLIVGNIYTIKEISLLPTKEQRIRFQEVGGGWSPRRFVLAQQKPEECAHQYDPSDASTIEKGFRFDMIKCAKCGGAKRHIDPMRDVA